MISEGDVEWRSADLIGDTIKNHRLPLKVGSLLAFLSDICSIIEDIHGVIRRQTQKYYNW